MFHRGIIFDVVVVVVVVTVVVVTVVIVAAAAAFVAVCLFVAFLFAFKKYLYESPRRKPG